MNTVKNVALSTSLILISLLFSQCGFGVNFQAIEGNGVVITENRPVKTPITTIKASQGLQVIITQSQQTSITVEADENIIEHIKTTIKGEVLKIHTEENIGRATKSIFVSLPKIELLSCTSGAKVICEDMIAADVIELKTTSGGNMKIEIDAQKAIVASSSGGFVEVFGNTKQCMVEASSGSSIDGQKLITKEAIATVSSGASITIYAQNQLQAQASSGGSVKYLGDPEIVSKNTSVSGSITKY